MKSFGVKNIELVGHVESWISNVAPDFERFVRAFAQMVTGHDCGSDYYDSDYERERSWGDQSELSEAKQDHVILVTSGHSSHHALELVSFMNLYNDFKTYLSLHHKIIPDKAFEYEFYDVLMKNDKFLVNLNQILKESFY